jgi:hypothetical protein
MSRQAWEMQIGDLRKQSLLFGGPGFTLHPVAAPGFRIQRVTKLAEGTAWKTVIQTNSRPAYVDWRVQLRCWDLAAYRDHGGSIVDHHLNGIHDGHFDEESTSSVDNSIIDTKAYSSPFQDFVDQLHQVEDAGYHFDGNGKRDGVGDMVFIGFWR